MSKEEKLLTFIVPAYNVEKYIGQCLDSLLNQSMRNHKVLIVDDGSTDGTAAICKEYVNMAPELFCYIHQQNKGLGGARNTGLQYVDTPYVTFLDSDDWQNLHFVRSVTEELWRQEESPEIIYTLPWIYNSVTHQLEEWHDAALFLKLFYPNNQKYTRIINAQIEPELFALEVSTCRKIYLTQFIRKIGFSFEEKIKWEDFVPSFMSLHYAKRCIGIRNVGFYYRINTGTQITEGRGASRLDLIPVFNSAIDLAETAHFSDMEWCYLIRGILGFTTWSFDVIGSDYCQKLLNGLQEVFLRIPQERIKKYFDTCSPHRRKEKATLFCIKRGFTLLFDDYWLKQHALAIAQKHVKR